MGVVLLIVGVVALVFGLVQHLKGKRILAAPFRSTGELKKDPKSSDAKGAMSSQGKVVAPAQALLSPCLKEPCLAYEVKVERLWEKIETTQEGSKTVTGSDTLETLRGGAVFGIDDGSGALMVDASKGGDFDNYKDGFKKELNGRGWSSNVQFGELRFDVPVLADSEKYTIGFRATERYVPVEGTLFVLGKIEPQGLVKPSWRSLLVSSKGRDGLLGSIRTKKKVSFIGGGVAAVLSVPLMIFMPATSKASPEKVETANAAPLSKVERAKAKLAELRGKKDVAPVNVAAADPFVIREGVASCLLKSNGSCSEYAAPSEAAEKGCKMFGGVYAENACPRENVVGACSMKSGDVTMLYAGGPMGLTRSSAQMMCPSNLGTLTVAPEVAVIANGAPAITKALEKLEPIVVDEAPAEALLEISAKRLSDLAVELNADCGSTNCSRGFTYIVTALSCDKSARWCQLDFTAMSRSSHQAYVASLPFTPAKATRTAFDDVISKGLIAFEAEPRSGKLPAVEAEKKTRVIEPLAAETKPAAAKPVAAAAAATPKPAAIPAAATPAPVNTPRAKPSSAPMQRSNKNMAD